MKDIRFTCEFRKALCALRNVYMWTLCLSYHYEKQTSSIQSLRQLVTVSIEYITLIMHISPFKVSMDIERGSGYFHVSPDKTGVVSLEYSEKNKQLQVRGKLKFQRREMTLTVKLTAVVEKFVEYNKIKETRESI